MHFSILLFPPIVPVVGHCQSALIQTQIALSSRNPPVGGESIDSNENGHMIHINNMFFSHPTMIAILETWWKLISHLPSSSDFSNYECIQHQTIRSIWPSMLMYVLKTWVAAHDDNVWSHGWSLHIALFKITNCTELPTVVISTNFWLIYAHNISKKNSLTC